MFLKQPILRQQRLTMQHAGGAGEYFLAERRQCLDLLRHLPGARVLDVGGGHAQLADPSENGYAVTVTGSADSCRRRLDQKRPGFLTYLTCDS
jgi:hypothetical protein